MDYLLPLSATILAYSLLMDIAIMPATGTVVFFPLFWFVQLLVHFCEAGLENCPQIALLGAVMVNSRMSLTCFCCQRISIVREEEK